MFKKWLDPVEERVVVSHLIGKELSNGRLIIIIKTLHESAVHSVQVPHGCVDVMHVFLYQLQRKADRTVCNKREEGEN